ncbi:MAG: ABC transporter permease [Clostridiales bacterium]|nr:ABC transporter permease [Clostridiales bacterium]MCF8022052.1 ABC transporter permease [Clostridiales bacterium]
MKNNNSMNAVFTAVVSVCIALLTAFIVGTISMVLIKGIPSFATSIQIKEIQFAIKLSLYTSVVSTLLCIILSLPIAYGMARLSFPGQKLVNSILEIPMALPPIVAGVALLILFGNSCFGNFLSGIGLDFVFTINGIILAQFFVNVPYMLRVLKTTIENIDPRLEFVARTLGCNKVQSFFKVTLPLAKNGLVAGIIITWARAIGEFGAALMLAGATRMRTETLPISLFLNMSTGDLELAMASATILIIISLVSLFVFQYFGGGTEHSRTGI